MHKIQEKILKLAKTHNISLMGPRELMRLLGVKHPQTAKYHLEQLKKRGLLYTDLKSKQFKIAKSGGYTLSRLLNIPIYGSANCGPATELAIDQVRGYIKISFGIIGRKSPDGLMAIKAIGDSLNQAQDIKGGTIKNGDYVIVDYKNKNPQDGDYVLSIIDEAANFKRFYREGDTIKLISESDQEYPPIYIHESEMDGYTVNGVVERVIKN